MTDKNSHSGNINSHDNQNSPETVTKIQVSLEINTGNLIYEEFTDIEEAMNFMREYHDNPQKILEKIAPKPKS